MQLVVARIGRAHGVRGEVTIEVRTDNPEERFQIGSVLQTDPAHIGPLKIASVRNHNGTLLLTFVGFEDRNSVEPLRNVLLISEVEVTQPGQDSDEFHVSQIIGSRVLDEAGLEVGVVIDVLQLPSQDTLVVERNGEELLVPFVHKHVPVVDVKNGEIRIANMEGML